MYQVAQTDEPRFGEGKLESVVEVDDPGGIKIILGSSTTNKTIKVHKGEKVGETISAIMEAGGG